MDHQHCLGHQLCGHVVESVVVVRVVRARSGLARVRGFVGFEPFDTMAEVKVHDGIESVVLNCGHIVGDRNSLSY